MQYFEASETAVAELSDRFTSADLVKYGKMEAMLFDPECCEESMALISEYPEIDKNQLKIQLQMFNNMNETTAKTLSEAVDVFKNLKLDVKKMFNQVVLG